MRAVEPGHFNVEERKEEFALLAGRPIETILFKAGKNVSPHSIPQVRRRRWTL